MAQLVNWGGQNNLKAGQLALAQQYADAGMFARAKAAFTQAGGVWSNAVHRLLKQEATDTTRYGGDIVFNWRDYGVRTQDQLNQITNWAKQGQFGRIANMVNNLGEKKWDADGNRLQKKLAAEYLGFQPKGTDPKTPSTEFKRAEPTTPTNLYKNITPDGGGTPTRDWKTQFKGTITPGQEGSWKSGQARNDAQKWRNLHMDAAMKKHGLSRGDDKKITRESNPNISDTDWDSFIKKRNQIAGRFERMIDHQS